MVLHRTTYTAQDVAVEFARGIHRASRFSWPEVSVLCTSQRLSLDEYVAGIGDAGYTSRLLPAS